MYLLVMRVCSRVVQMSIYFNILSYFIVFSSLAFVCQCKTIQQWIRQFILSTMVFVLSQ